MLSSTFQPPSERRVTRISGTTVLPHDRMTGRAGLSANLHHIRKGLGIHAAELHQLNAVMFGQKVEVIKHGLHRRIQAIAFPQLQGQAFGQVPREDTAMDRTVAAFLQRRFDLVQRGRIELPASVARSPAT